MQDTMVQELALANKQLLMVSSWPKVHPPLHYSFSHWDSQAPGRCHYTRAATLNPEIKAPFHRFFVSSCRVPKLSSLCSSHLGKTVP